MTTVDDGVRAGRRRGRGRGHGAPSMADVARMAGVSPQTVSRVANNRTNVDGTTRERVLDAMRALGYQPNIAARALATGRFGTIGVISFTVSNHGNARTLDGIADAAREAGFSINLVGITTPTRQAVRKAFGHLSTQAVDGIAIIEAEVLDTPSLLLPRGVPVVVADGHGSQEHPVIDSDQAAGARLATEHLLDLGHSTVWHVAGPPDSNSARHRHASWRRTLERAGRQVPQVLFGDWSAESGHRLGAYLAGRPDVTAIFAANDQMALGVLRALHEAGRAIPDEVSVVGFDDMPESAYFWPGLTSVRQDFAQVGRLCVQTLLAQIHVGAQEAGAAGDGTAMSAGVSAVAGLTAGMVHTVPVELKVRGSSGAPRSGRLRLTDV
ncbi:LacI family DNA-binding transcriptional regulator [Microbispora sp. NPDC049125]|uniref:LacI family DNA-binding transcriptional regulator n=1 Tax=Microbispora sp. NPDC049125 TaxID=3154929 RepID=UPI0034653552